MQWIFVGTRFIASEGVIIGASGMSRGDSHLASLVRGRDQSVPTKNGQMNIDHVIRTTPKRRRYPHV